METLKLLLLYSIMLIGIFSFGWSTEVIVYAFIIDITLYFTVYQYLILPSIYDDNLSIERKEEFDRLLEIDSEGDDTVFHLKNDLYFCFFFTSLFIIMRALFPIINMIDSWLIIVAIPIIIIITFVDEVRSYKNEKLYEVDTPSNWSARRFFLFKIVLGFYLFEAIIPYNNELRWILYLFLMLIFDIWRKNGINELRNIKGI